MKLARQRKSGLPAQAAAGEDGDFVQLRIVRERRKPLLEMKRRQQENELKGHAKKDTADPVDGVIVEEHQMLSRDPPKPRPNTAARVRANEEVRDQLFDTADGGDFSQLQAIMSKIGSLEQVNKLRHPKTDENILHYALSNDKKQLAMKLMNSCTPTFLLSHHTVNRSGISGKNNSLHIITEKNDIEMAKFLLSKLETKERKLEAMHLETAVDIQGQRPRLFSCLHLAAYYGNTSLVRLYLDNGVDVNHLNGKKDTALLWAARWGHNEAVHLLIDRGANTEVKNDKGSTALYWAIRYEFPKTVSILLEKGKANPNTERKLGLVAPIVIAAAYGNEEIMSILLQHPDINIDVSIRGGEMAVHHAAMEGCGKILEMLINRGAKFDAQDETGDTPLLLAAKSGHYEIVQDLIRKGANVNHRNHEGHDAWYYAIEDEEDNSLLQNLVIATRGQDMLWRHPLCIAAANGRADKVQFLLKINTEPMSADADGNTFLHHAAMNDKFEIIEQFNSTISINVQNNRGNTPLHIACYRGFAKTVNVLIQCKAKADVKNNKGETALHVAGHSKHISAETVRELVEYTIKTHAWESLNAKDLEGNNALHIAGKHAKPEVLWEFRFVRFKDRDKDGLIPLHEAVRPGQPEALEMMLDIFERMKRDARINEKSYKKGETVLHLAADEGHSKCVKRLIALGADLAVQDFNGDTVLHRLTKACVENNRDSNRHLEVMDVVFENSVKWWCIKKNIPFPEEENQEMLMSHKRDATLYLINDICNKEGLSVIDQGFKSGVSHVLSRLLMMPNVTMYETSDPFSYTFDVTGLTPRTNNALQGCCGRNTSIAPLTEKDMLSNTSESRLSGVEWLITHTAKSRAAEILDLPPIRVIEKYYTSMVAWTFACMMLVHIVYMSMLTYVGINLLEKLRVNEEAINSSDQETILLYAVIPIEPALIVIYVMSSTLRYFLTGDIDRRSKMSTKKGFRRVVSIIASYMFLIICLIFSGLVFAWIGLFTSRYSYNDYVFAAAVCIGWLLTISFTRGIRAIHYFYRLLISMIIRDVVRFVIVYLFVILAFGFAFHAIFQVSAETVESYGSIFDTLFLTFNMMIGMGELFDGTFESNMAIVGRSATYAKILYLIYIILSTIILLNLLIAMMNDSYSRILKENQIAWRIESVSMGLEMESSIARARSFSNVKINKGDVDSIVQGISSERWYVAIKEKEYRERMRENDHKYTTYEDEVSKRLDDVDTRVEELEKTISTKLQHITNLLEQIKKK
ncbi:uncharacterized protein LOC128235246 isoform X1 [Mya arenaria]|uniref:uncharacterized protein LOC128235246 isoform X1 n=1 Tax=Mya arenaria TaxID=6604 RepID=UPI0022E595B3|nr:uncharacterized protein LOC128235246 isoform X1 [Mya arenaria]